MNDFTRPREGFKFKFGGMKLNSRPDTLPPDKYAIAVNVRGYKDSSIQTRPGLATLFTTGFANSGSTDLRAYSALGTDNLPRILTRNMDDTIWLDDGTQVGTLAGSGGTPGAAMIPFRPNASPNPYMYVANGKDYQKFPAPNPTVVAQKVGIKEPPLAPEAYPLEFNLGTSVIYQTHGTPVFTSGGTAGATASGARVSDTVVASFQDPNASADFISHPVSLQVATTVSYQKFMMIKVGSSFARVVDVVPAIAGAITISSIYYFSGSTGRCVLVPNVVSSEPSGNESIYGTTQLNSLRRGALIKIGSEVCLVWSVTFGPDNAICIETSTTGAHTTADALSGVPTVIIMGGTGSFATLAITSADDTFSVTTGVGTITATISPNPFVISGGGYQVDDYLHFSLNVDVLTNLIEAKLLLDIGDGTFTKDFFYYTIRPSDIAAAVANTATQLSIAQTVRQRAIIDEENAAAARNQGITFSSAQTSAGASQWAEFLIPINALTRVGNDQTRSLQTLSKIQLLFNASGTIACAVNSIYVAGGNQVDVGEIGAPYLYRVRGRSSVTGAISNPSPPTRYGVNPRRNAVKVIIPNGNSPYDSQIDTWDIFRYGGSVTSWRYVGSTPPSINPTIFVDNFDDAAVGAGPALDFDNFEPWPSVDAPLIQFQTANPAGSGTAVLVSIPTATNVLRFLPGTLVQFLGTGSSSIYTLRSRPTLVSGTTYLFNFEECVSGIGAGLGVQILEPLLANQMLPYMWGPDANGTIFAVGDSLRPGTLYFAKNNNPDSAPDTYNIEITPPTEPLLGGETIDGLSFVGSPERWWALYPTPDNPSQRYNIVQQPFARGLAAPYGHCNDGKSLYWWAKDGIQSSSQGSLTDADLYDLFPHEGVQGKSVTYSGVTALAPDYSLTSKFRLTHANGFLYAIYPFVGGSGNYAMLVLNLHTMAWTVDQYDGSAGIFNVYKVEQQTQSNQVLNSVVLLAGTVDAGHSQGRIYVQTDNVNDVTTPITCKLACAEFDGGDSRAPKQWGDLFLDLLPAAATGGPTGVRVFPMSLGTNVAPLTVVPTNTARVRVPISVGGIVVSDFMGLLLQWTDDFSVQSGPTILYSWQPSFDIQPPAAIGWKTFASSFGLQGYGHIRQIAIAWVSTAPVTLTLTTFDGQDPAPIVIPSSGGVYQKQLFPLTANKGQLFTFQATSTAPFQIFEDDCEVHVGQWGREGGYAILKSFGGQNDAQSPI